jgi:hypothetical protein
MIAIDALLKEYALAKKYKLTHLDDGKYCIDIAMKLKDESYRYQFVWLWVAEGRGKGKDCVYFTSRVGHYTPNIDLYRLVKEAGHGVYTTVTVVADKDKAGNPCESIVVQASPVLEFLSKEAFLFILWEVAEVADILEERHFGKDQQ